MKFNYEKIIANLEAKASRQRQALNTTEEQIAAFKQLQAQEQPQLPLDKDKNKK